MPRSRDEIVDHFHDELISTLFAGYFTKSAENAYLFRKMGNDSEKVRMKLREMYDEVRNEFLGTQGPPLPVKTEVPVAKAAEPKSTPPGVFRRPG